MPWKNGVQATLGLGKNVKNQKWEWNLIIAKWDLEKNELGNGIGIPLQDTLETAMVDLAI